MSEKILRYSLLEKYYQQYLADEISANFIQSISELYTIETLKRMYRDGDRILRRAAILALGFLGDFSVNETLGLALSDTDRGVRMLADHGIRTIWERQGVPQEQIKLRRLYRLNDCDLFDEACNLADELLARNPQLSEAWNQRAIAYCALGHFEAAIEDCRETLACNRYHFPAAMGMAHCSLQLDDPQSALDGFRLALQINPDLDLVRQQVFQLEQSLGPE